MKISLYWLVDDDEIVPVAELHDEDMLRFVAYKEFHRAESNLPDDTPARIYRAQKFSTLDDFDRFGTLRMVVFGMTFSVAVRIVDANIIPPPITRRLVAELIDP